MTYAKLIGTGSYLPEKILTNYDIEKIVETSHQWIVERTGIIQRHIVSDHETASFMAEKAARNALEMAGMAASEIDMIIISTSTPERMFPSTACLLQDRLGISGCPAFDLNSVACSGFVYGLSIADQYIRNGKVKKILVIGAEAMTRILDWTDRSTCVLFGDGAGAFILSADSKPGILATHIHADGRHKEVLTVPISLGRPIQVDPIQMAGSQLFKLAVNILGDLFDETLAASSLQKSEVDWLIPHQANIRIIEAMAKKLSLPMDRVAVTLAEQGNTSSASIPLALDKTLRAGLIKPGQLLMLEGFGGGLTWGSALIRY